jgi:cytoskeletal protein CcmA (bactofilin family)
MFFKKKPQGKPMAMNMGAPPSVEGDGAEPSYLGRDVAVDGQISCDGELHVDGAFRGTVRARVCVIDTHGVVQGELSGDVIHVRGRVIGPIQGAKVYIHAGAHVEGDVFHDTISIENGAYVYGTIRHNATPVPAASPFPALNIGLGETSSAIPVAEPLDDAKDAASSIRVVHSRK